MQQCVADLPVLILTDFAADDATPKLDGIFGKDKAIRAVAAIPALQTPAGRLANVWNRPSVSGSIGLPHKRSIE
jgi:hypothetical protein